MVRLGPTLRRRKAKNTGRRLPIRRLLIIAGIAGVLLAALTCWIVVLDRQIVRQFEGRRWNRRRRYMPARWSSTRLRPARTRWKPN